MSIKALVIDDSALMRKYLREILTDAGDFVVEVARDGQDGLEKIATFNPDVVSLDINMPVMDGLTCLSMIMTECPVPVVMVSSLTEKGALTTFEAMELGAVDYVAKPGGTVSLDIKTVADDIVGKLRAAAKSRPRKSLSLQQRLRQQRETVTESIKTSKPKASWSGKSGVVVVGVSTGGPATVEQILDALPASFPLPIVIAQHMPSRFTQVFADRLNQRCALNISEVDKPVELLPGHVYVAKGDADVKISTRGAKKMVMTVPASATHLWHPSVDRLVESAMEHYQPSEIIAVQLTGMGNDGANAMATLYQNGGMTIAESEETAVVFGMPKELIEMGAAEVVLPSDQIAGYLCELMNKALRKRA